MKLSLYIKDKLPSILAYILKVSLLCLILKIFNLNNYILIIILLIELLTGLVILLINYLPKRKYFNSIIDNLEKLDKKYLILETIYKPINNEERIINDILYDINKSMIENIKAKENNLSEYKEFIELWIHEVKLPISSLVLKCHNNKEKYGNDLLYIVRKIDNYVDDVLYYVRSENPEKDFLINEVNLKEVIRNVSLKNKDDLLENKINLEVSKINNKVYTDKKWLEYIINQIINNSIKYKKEKDSFIKIETIEDKNSIKLIILDNGIGIPSKDITRIFEKTFTGSNGRDKTKSTGMGLYIVNKLIDKLGHKIEVESIKGKYTKIIISFGKNNLYNVTKM